MEKYGILGAEGGGGVMLIAFGANAPSQAGAPLDAIAQALSHLESSGARIMRFSRLYQSPAWPAGSGPDYVNAAAMISTPLSSQAFLRHILTIEDQMGRVRVERWGPRPIDLDLIACGDMIFPDPVEWRRWADMTPAQIAETQTPELILPHPRAHQRAFVLKPLRDIAPDWRHPILGLTAADLAADLSDADMQAVSPVEDTEIFAKWR